MSACSACTDGEFTDQPGATSCASCPSASSSTYPHAACVCNVGYFGTLVTDARSNRTVLTCLTCPTGSACTTADATRTRTTLVSAVGFWRIPAAAQAATTASVVVSPSLATEADPVFMACPFKAACPSSANSSCNPGYEGVLCGVCKVGYHVTNDGCVACAGSSQYVLPVVCTLVVVAVVVLFYLSRFVDPKTLVRLVNTTQVLIGYLQVMGSSSSSYDIPWPAFMQGLLGSFRVALMDVFQVTAVDCWQKMDFWTPYWITILTTSVLLLLAPLLHAVIPIVFQRCAACASLDEDRRKRLRGLTVKGIAIFMSVFFPAISLKSLSLWNCTQVGNESYLTSDLSVPCRYAKHSRTRHG
jgi:hypothetical protein